MKITYNDKVIAYSTLLSGLSISAVAVYYSVAGLMSIFAASAISIMIMGVVLELGKLVATLWLKQNWFLAPKILRSYLLSAVFILMTITSMGIFGYLSKAHLDQAVPTSDIADKVLLIDEKIKTQKDNIDVSRKALAQMDATVDQTISRSSNEQGASRASQLRKTQSKERASLQADIAASQKEIAALNDERAPIAKELRKVEAEVGPIKYIAALIYGDNLDANLLEKAVRWVIILIVIIFDPLAIVLLLASQYSFQWFRENEDESPIPAAVIAIPAIVPSEPEIDIDAVNQLAAEAAIEAAIEAAAGREEVIEEPVKLQDEFDITKHPYLFNHPTVRHPPGVEPVGPLVYIPEVKEPIVYPELHTVEEQPETETLTDPNVANAALKAVFFDRPEYFAQVEDIAELERPGDYVLEETQPVVEQINTSDTAITADVERTGESYITKDHNKQIKVAYVQNSEQGKNTTWNKIEHTDE